MTAYTSIRVTRRVHKLILQMAQRDDRTVGATVERLIRIAAEDAGIVQRRKTSIRGTGGKGNSN